MCNGPFEGRELERMPVGYRCLASGTLAVTAAIWQHDVYETFLDALAVGRLHDTVPGRPDFDI